MRNPKVKSAPGVQMNQQRVDAPALRWLQLQLVGIYNLTYFRGVCGLAPTAVRQGSVHGSPLLHTHHTLALQGPLRRLLSALWGVRAEPGSQSSACLKGLQDGLGQQARGPAWEGTRRAQGPKTILRVTVVPIPRAKPWHQDRKPSRFEPAQDQHLCFSHTSERGQSIHLSSRQTQTALFLGSGT